MQYDGLNVLVKETSVCIVDKAGKVSSVFRSFAGNKNDEAMSKRGESLVTGMRCQYFSATERVRGSVRHSPAGRYRLTQCSPITVLGSARRTRHRTVAPTCKPAAWPEGTTISMDLPSVLVNRFG